jgi:predicted HTH transcriptional regulator
LEVSALSVSLPEETDKIECKRNHAEQTPFRLGDIPSPNQKPAFRQLEVYYYEKKLKLNAEFPSSLGLVDENGCYNYTAYLLADENDVSVRLVRYAGTDRTEVLEDEDFGRRCLITAANRVLDKLYAESRALAVAASKLRPDLGIVDGTAIREALINAVVHNDYTRERPPVAEIFSDRFAITSCGGLPRGMDRDRFFRCRSVPRNRGLMRVFRDAGFAEQLGSGLGRILGLYERSVFTFEDELLTVTFPFDGSFLLPREEAQSKKRVIVKEEIEGELLAFCVLPRARYEMQQHVGIANREYFRKMILKPMVIAGKLSMTVPNNPNSRSQKYVRV